MITYQMSDGSWLLRSNGSVRIIAPGISQADTVAAMQAFAVQPPVTLQGAQRMADVVAFGSAYISAVKVLIDDLENLRTLQARIAQDSTLFANYLASPGARPDLNGSALAAANDAVTQILFAYDSGSPPQKAKLFNLL